MPPAQEKGGQEGEPLSSRRARWPVLPLKGDDARPGPGPFCLRLTSPSLLPPSVFLPLRLHSVCRGSRNSHASLPVRGSTPAQKRADKGPFEMCKIRFCL